MEKFEIKINGFDTVSRKVGTSRGSGRIFVPKSWIGKEVRVILLEEPEDEKTE